MWVLVIPNNLINSLIHQLYVVISLCVRVKQIYLPVLVLEYQFSGWFVYKHPQYRIVRFMLHDDIFILQMIKFKLWSVIKHDKEYFRNEKLKYLLLTLHRKNLLLNLRILNRINNHFVLVGQCTYPFIVE